MIPKKVIDNRKKNVKRKITDEVFEECLKRDGGCVICLNLECLPHNTLMDLDRPHHVWYGLQAQYGADRNDVSKLVTICRTHHHRLHFGGGNNYREFTKQYLQSIYGNNNPS